MFVSAAFASRPVAVEIIGCVKDGTIISESTDFGTHKIADGYIIRLVQMDTPSDGTPQSTPVDLSPYEGKKLRVRGYLLPGDRLGLSQNGYEVIGQCAANSADGTTGGKMWTPTVGDPDRKAIINAVRPTIQSEIGGQIEFVVDILRTNGSWAYLQATPQRPGGAPIDWSKTKFAKDWDEDMMTDVVMALVRRHGARWRLEDHVLGPTDVYWTWWVTSRNVPESLFHKGEPFVQ